MKDELVFQNQESREDEKQYQKWVLASKSLGRFLGESPPDVSFRQLPLAWVRWGMRMLGYHLPVRIAILPGDLPVHDYHHRYPMSPEWPNAVYARQRDLEAGCPVWPEPYTEVWGGLFEAIDHVFDSLSKAPPLPEELAPMSSKAIADVSNGM